MTRSEPSLLILTHCFPKNTSDIPGNFIYDLCGSLTSAGVRVTVMTQEMSGAADENFLKRCGAEIEYFDWKGGQERFTGLSFASLKKIRGVISLIFKGRKKYRELTEKNNYDLILNCWTVPSGLWSYGRTKSAKKAVWALGSDINIYAEKVFTKKVLKKILLKNDHIFANSLSLKKKIKDIFGINASILYSGRKLPEPQRSYKPAKTLRLAFVGRLEEVKGPDILLSAIALSGIKDFELTIVGDGQMRGGLEDSARSSGLGDKIIFTGMTGPCEIAEILAQSDYLVISSRNESMPVVFWEAMQTSTPVLSTDVGDIKYYCDEFNVGRVCGTDENSLAGLLSFADSFRPLRQVMAENTIKLAGKTSLSATAEILKEIMQNH